MTTVFVVIAALLVLAALAVVILPLVRGAPHEQTAEAEDNSQRFAVLSDSVRELNTELEAGTLDRSEYEEAKTELERQAVDADEVPRGRIGSTTRTAWVPALAVVVALPLLAVVLYVAVGRPGAIGVEAGGVVAQRSGVNAAAHIDAMIARLKQRLQTDSQDARGWTLLAHVYEAAGQPQNAIDAYRRAVALVPNNADLLVDYANALGMAHGRSLAGKPQQLLQRALELEPDNASALALAGAAALQQGNRDAAVRYWQHLKRLLPPGSSKQSRVEMLIARARGEQTQVVAESAIQGTITVSEELREKITAADTLFVFARAPDGPKMPVAVLRKPAPQFPMQFTLDDTHAMVSGVHLSQYPVVDIVARISRTGKAALQPGDLEGRVKSVPVGSENVRIVIDNRIGS